MKLKDVPLFQGLSVEAVSSIEGYMRQSSYQKGEVLFHEGEGCDRVFIVESGRVKLYRTASSGREQILEILEPGETCACNPGNLKWYCSATAETMMPSTVWFLSRKDYVDLVNSNPSVSHSLNELFARRLQCFTNLIEEVSLKDVKKRLVKFLLDMQAHRKSTLSKNVDSVYIPFTHEEIAQRLGTARETVTRNLSALKKDKLIEFTPAHILIKDKAGLQEILEK